MALNVRDFNQLPNELFVSLWPNQIEGSIQSSMDVRIDLRRSLKQRWIVEKEDGGSEMLEEMVGQPIMNTYCVDSRLFLYPEIAFSFASDLLKLVNMDAHDQPRAIHQISSFGKRISNAGEGSKMMCMCVNFLVMEVFFLDEREAMGRALQESMDEGSLGCVIPASRSSIDQLQSVRFESGGSDSTKDCTICLEELRVGSLVTELPCNHLFHGECITRWLETSHLCPLCRFQMPV